MPRNGRGCSDRVRKSTAPPRTRYRLSIIAAISGGVMFERNMGTCWLGARRWRMSYLPFFRPVTKLIPSR